MATNWNEQASAMWKAWSESQKAWLESLARPAAGLAPSFPQGVPGQDAARQMTDAWKASVEQWMGLLGQGSYSAFSQESLRKIMDPAEWAKPAPGSFDFGIEQLIEGPNFATLWDLDRKMLKLQQLGLKRAEDSAAYHAIVFAAWNRAGDRFARQLTSGEGGAPGSYRELIDRWIRTANETLLEVHRSPEFLDAQRRVTRSATDYRLAEREIAEVWCEMHHLPTRSEMDEMQRTVYQLRRDLRALQRTVQETQPRNGAASSPAKAPRPQRVATRKAKKSGGESP